MVRTLQYGFYCRTVFHSSSSKLVGLLSLSFSTFLSPMYLSSFYPEAGEAAINYSLAAPLQTVTQRYSWPGTGRQGGQAGEDLLENGGGGGGADGFPSHPRTRAETKDSSRWGSACAFSHVLHISIHFFLALATLRGERGGNLWMVKLKTQGDGFSS